MKRSFLVLMALLVTLVAGVMAGVFNLQAKNRAVTAAWQEVAAGYQERATLLPRYLASVKRHMPVEAVIVRTAEQETLRANQRLAGTPPATVRNFEQVVAVQAGLTGTMAQLTAAIEGNQALQADPEFARLNTQLAAIEGKITRGWRSYNQVAHSFNLFKQSLFARVANSVICRYDAKILFGEEEGASVVLGSAG